MRYRVPHRSAATQAGLTPVLGGTMRNLAIFAVVLLVCSVQGCGDTPSDSFVHSQDQRPTDSGGVDVPVDQQQDVIASVQSIARQYGLTEHRGHDLEAAVGASEHRSVFFAYYTKEGWEALSLSNGISSTRFSYQIYREPFSLSEHQEFRRLVLTTLSPTGNE